MLYFIQKFNCNIVFSQAMKKGIKIRNPKTINYETKYIPG